MSDFNRSRQDFAQNPTLEVIYFRFSGRVKEKFDRAYPQEGGFRFWDRQINYKSCELVFTRVRDKSGQDILFNVVLLPESDVEHPNGNIELLVKAADDYQSFFVIAITLRNQSPTQLGKSETFECEVHWIHVKDRIGFSNGFGLLMTKLSSLPLTQSVKRFDVTKEIKVWDLYLQAQEKAMREKTILISVKNGKENTRRPRGKSGKKWISVIEYDLDIAAYGEDAIERAKEIVLPRGIVSGKRSDMEITLHLAGMEPLSTEIKQELDGETDTYPEDFYRLKGDEKYSFPAQFTLKYTTKEDQDAVLESICSRLVAKNANCSIRKNGFQLQSWNDRVELQQELESFDGIFQPIAPVQAEFILSHEFEDEATTQLLLRQTTAGLQAFRSVSEVQIQNREITFRTTGLQVEFQESLETHFALSWMEITLSLSEKPEAFRIKGDEFLRGHEIGFRAQSRAEAEKKYAQLLKHHPDLGIPELEKASAAWCFGLQYHTTGAAAKWKENLITQLRKIPQLTLNWPKVSCTIQRQAELEDWQKRIAQTAEQLEVQLQGLVQKVNFITDTTQKQRELIASIQEKINTAIPEVSYSEKTAGNATGTVGFIARATVKNPGQMENLKAFLGKIDPALWDISFPEPEGSTQIELIFDKEMFREELDLRWSDLRNKGMKLLSPKEKKAYEAEIKGKKSDYRGGIELGKLIGLRDGKAVVELGDDFKKGEEVTEGYLLPVFYGDLAQLSRLKEAIRIVKFPNNDWPKNRNLANFIFNPDLATPIEIETDIHQDSFWQITHDLNEKGLNEKQKEAVWKALHTQDMVLIQGPPGTGKTTVIAEIIWQQLQENPDSKILISSQAHLAVDNALERLYRKNLIRPLRIASSDQAKKAVEPEGRKYFEFVITNWAKKDTKPEEIEANVVSEWVSRIENSVKILPSFEKPLEQWKAILQNPTPDVRGFFRDLYMKNVNIVAATCLECGRKDFKEDFKEGFDLVIVDEASKATPPEILLPLIMGRKVVIIGDHKQLPPMVEDQSLVEMLEEMGETGLAEQMEEITLSQFEKLFLGADDSIKVTLTEQYRMHDNIMRVINEFYQDEGGLKCGILETMNIADRKHKGSRWHGLNISNILTPETHLMWVDVNGPETFHSPSYSNEGEVEAIRSILKMLSESPDFAQWKKDMPKEEDQEVGIITFYGKQAEKLREVVNEFKDTVPTRLRTVDKFQGMERNIVIVSTVRSHEQVTENWDRVKPPRKNSGIGFAKDYRRINVAFSRARQLLIIVGNEDHFSHNNEIYQRVKETTGRYGSRISANQLNP